MRLDTRPADAQAKCCRGGHNPKKDSRSRKKPVLSKDTQLKVCNGRATPGAMRQHSANSQGGQGLLLSCQQNSVHSKVGRLRLDLSLQPMQPVNCTDTPAAWGPPVEATVTFPRWNLGRAAQRPTPAASAAAAEAAVPPARSAARRLSPSQALHRRETRPLSGRSAGSCAIAVPQARSAERRQRPCWVFAQMR